MSESRVLTAAACVIALALLLWAVMAALDTARGRGCYRTEPVGTTRATISRPVEC